MEVTVQANFMMVSPRCPRTMEKARLRTIIGSAMVGLGLLQSAWGLLQDDLAFAVFGLIYALIGAAYLWFEV